MRSSARIIFTYRLVLTICRLKASHLVQKRNSRLQNGVRYSYSGAFAQTQIQIQQWLRSKILQQLPMATLLRAMTEYGIVCNLRSQCARCKEGRCSDKTIDKDDHTASRGLQHSTGHLRDLETTVCGERAQRRRWCAMKLCCALQHGYLVVERRIAQACATAYTLPDRYTGKGMHQRAGGRGVAYSHLAKPDNVAALVANGADHGSPLFNTSGCLLLRHCGTLREISRALADLGVYQSIEPGRKS